MLKVKMKLAVKMRMRMRMRVRVRASSCFEVHDDHHADEELDCIEHGLDEYRRHVGRCVSHEAWIFGVHEVDETTHLRFRLS